MLLRQMSLKTIMNADWSDYDKRKISEGSNIHHFRSGEPWEIDYLVDKITHEYPTITHIAVRSAIAICCVTIDGPHPRSLFVACILEYLGLY